MRKLQCAQLQCAQLQCAQNRCAQMTNAQIQCAQKVTTHIEYLYQHITPCFHCGQVLFEFKMISFLFHKL